MVKKALISLLLLGIAGLSHARTLYTIELRGQPPVVARDLPVENGSVLLFHRHSDGRLTGVPREDVLRVLEQAAPQRASRRGRAGARTAVVTGAAPVQGGPMQPGETVVLGPTGNDGGVRAAGGATGTGAAGSSQGGSAPGTSGNAAGSVAPVGPDGLPAGTSSGNAPTAATGPVTNPTLVDPQATAPVVGGDGLPRAQSGPPPTVDPVTGSTPTNPPVGGSTANPVGSTAPTTTVNPPGTTPAGSTVNPAGSTPQGTTVQPAGTTTQGTTVQPGTTTQPQTGATTQPRSAAPPRGTTGQTGATGPTGSAGQTGNTSSGVRNNSGQTGTSGQTGNTNQSGSNPNNTNTTNSNTSASSPRN